MKIGGVSKNKIYGAKIFNKHMAAKSFRLF